MPTGDNTVDNRWRPGFGSSLRRVREEEADVADAKPVPTRTVLSRELSFVPDNRRPSFEGSNPETHALIRRYQDLSSLPNGEAVVARLEEWKWPWAGRSAADKQRYLEPLIHQVRRDPAANEDILLFLLIVFEPVRRSISGAFRRASAGITPQEKDVNWSNRAEAKLLRHVERERLEDVTRSAVLTAILRYPTDSPRALFGWLKETVAHRALDTLRDELPQFTDGSLDAPEARAIGVFLDLAPDLEAPAADEGWPEPRREPNRGPIPTERFRPTRSYTNPRDVTQAWPFLTFSAREGEAETRLYIDAAFAVEPDDQRYDDGDAFRAAAALIDFNTHTAAEVVITEDGGLVVTFDDQRVLRIDGVSEAFTTGEPWALHAV